VNAETRLEQMLFYAQVHAEDADEVSALLLDAFTRPHFTDASFDSERAVVLQELSAGAADPSDAVQDAVLAALFPEHPLGRPVGGSPDQIARLRLADVQAVHEAMVRDVPATLFCVGPRIPESLRRLRVVDAADLTPLESSPPVAGPPAPVGAVSSWPTGVEYCYVCCGARSPAAGSPDRPAYTVLAHLLGSSPSSLLYRELRDNHSVSYDFSAWDRGYREAGAWRVLIGTTPDNAERVTQIVADLLAQLAADGPRADDLAAARRQATMSLVLESEDPLGQARLIATVTASGTRPWSMDEEIDALNRVTASDVRAAAADIAGRLLITVRPSGK
jgi:predicted Zn-dependent peptidase